MKYEKVNLNCSAISRYYCFFPLGKQKKFLSETLKKYFTDFVCLFI